MTRLAVEPRVRGRHRACEQRKTPHRYAPTSQARTAATSEPAFSDQRGRRAPVIFAEAVGEHIGLHPTVRARGTRILVAPA
jgi:hypothetical protein